MSQKFPWDAQLLSSKSAENDGLRLNAEVEQGQLRGRMTGVARFVAALFIHLQGQRPGYTRKRSKT